MQQQEYNCVASTQQGRKASVYNTGDPLRHLSGLTYSYNKKFMEHYKN